MSRGSRRHAGTRTCVVLAMAASVMSVEAEENAQVEAGTDGFSLRSADGAWALELHGLVHFDGRWFSGDSAADGADEWLLRRVRPSVEGTFGERIAVRLMPDFGEGDAELVDAYVDVGIGGGVTLRAGKFKTPVGLERLQASNSLRMVERSFVTELLPNRDIGLALSGGGEHVSYSVGLFNGVNDGRSGDQDDDGNQEIALRVFAHPLASRDSDTTFGIGVGATYGDTEGKSGTPLLSGYRSPGQSTVFSYREGEDPTLADGERLRVSPQLYWYRGPLGVLAEWARVRQDVRRAGLARSATLEHDAWQATAEWFLTGEAAGYRDPDTTGAVQLVARIARLDVDEQAFAGGTASFADPAAAVRRADTWGAGVNWRPLAGLKASLAYQHTAFAGGAAGGDRPDEKTIFLRLQQTF